MSLIPALGTTLRVIADGLIANAEELPPTPRDQARHIIARAALHHGVKARDIVGPSRRRGPLVAARWQVVAELRAILREDGTHRYSTPVIGRIISRDHTTVVHALARMAGGGAT